MKTFFLPILIVLVCSFASCEKVEGPGGTSKIIGNVWVRNYNADFSRLNNEYWAQEQDVYLIYGSDSIHSDKTETSYNGSFMFEYLQKGDYTVFVYSKDSTLAAPSGYVPVTTQVSISDKGETVVIPTITIFN
ncbi:MAG TPA: hypothetical protein DCQ26_15690 [Marinilabiliales bacterium]|jgi:hypothetical protein|nr:MAG: hypothetical protein A2W95_16070 [Bacteroidetes bacterium GWA2_40_14]OFX64085.1 MAG: hypothetical protein A2W84_01705 [Bacteroidetes bacterium GWC2_40_13]OFX73842.1 MAG: hypothetical protein A2W96_19435 [Bacteroidetes bacterium GWD2_40_43]OFX91178.1 MAG: hypothetical protein A2W97_14575 [Bacteroidetes bacterium GWE2_40_63]OFY22854.1 MAG: hypothetical protein A2W88_08670 [Bacteroidetes bacterium GWF2_40_13]OFZ25886.1 MAG: hypothetical protein A2437_16910 [Bacteroidetes bacterium RIFOXYC